MMRDFGSDSTHATSIESSPVFFEDRVYISNSGGLIQGFNINALIAGATRQEALVFEHWVGDDVDATMVTDEIGNLYVSIQDEARSTQAQIIASEQNGHLVKLNPYDPINPIVASFTIPRSERAPESDGFWATPSINRTHIFITAHNGRLYVLNRETLEVVYREDLGSHNWASSVLVGNQLLVPTCFPSGLVAYDVSNPSQPQKMWTYEHPSGCIESTPLVWKGNIFVGSRDGYFYKIGL
jgi:outer membrane protein assembly factor BamB